MRIRKLIAQKKISATNSSSSIPCSCSAAVATATTTTTSCEEEERVNNCSSQKPLICELNMSPWELIPVEKLLYYRPDEDSEVLKTEEEEDNDDEITDKSANAEEDQRSIEENDIESEETDTESEEDDDEETEEDELEVKRYVMGSKGKLGLKSVTKNNQKRKRDNHDTDDYEKEKKKKIAVYCCKTDGKGWHCRSKAQIGNPLCEHHMIQMQGYILHQRDTYHQRKIRKLEGKKTTRRGRPPNTINTSRRNKGKLSGGKSSEFYYYSGFGPLWGKNKRGRPPNEVKKQEEEALTRQVIIDEALIRPTSPIMKTVKEEENDNDNGCMFVDDDFDDTTDEDDTNNSVKKRYRKPIKARSLKSLF